MLEHFTDVNLMSDVLRQAQTGLWAIELDEGKGKDLYTLRRRIYTDGLQRVRSLFSIAEMCDGKAWVPFCGPRRPRKNNS